MWDCLPFCILIPWWSLPAPGPPFLWCWNDCFVWSVLLIVNACVWEKVAWGVPFFFPLVSLMFLLYIPHCSLDDGNGNCRLDHFCYPWVLVLGLHEGLFDCSVSFKVNLYTILTAYLFNTFCCSFCVWDDYLSYCGLICLSIVGLVVDVCVPIVVTTCVVDVDWIAVAYILPVVV